MKSRAEMESKSYELVGYPEGSAEHEAGWLLRDVHGEEEADGYSEAGIIDMLAPLGNADSLEAEARELVRIFLFS